MSLLSSLTTSGLADPSTASTIQSVYTTVWTTTVLAVNDQTTWETVYTVTEVRTADPADYFRAAISSSLTETPAANSPCTHSQDFIIVSPTDASNEDAFTATTATTQAAATPDEDSVDADPFAPTVPQDFHPDLAGGNIAPPGAAPFPEGEGTEFRSVDSAADVEFVTAVQSVLPVMATADPSITTDEADALRTGDPADDDSGLTVDEILPLLSNLNLTSSRATPSIVLVVPPEESGESEEDSISIDDFHLNNGTGSVSFRDPLSSGADILVTGPTGTSSLESSSFSTVTVPRTTSVGDFSLLSASTSSVTTDDDVSTTATTTTTAETSTTTSLEEVILTTTSTVSPSASATVAADGEADDTDDQEEREGLEKSSNGEYIVTAAAQRVRAPTQSTTLLVVNAMLVGILLL